MAFSIQNLAVLAYANGFTLWHYKAGDDDHALVGRPGFFTCAGDMLNAGDMVMVSSGSGGRLMCLSNGRTGLQATALN